MIGILAEKPSQARNFAQALGGMSGTFQGQQYVICPARGHLYGFVNDPSAMVDSSLAKKYSSWDVKELPWNETDLNWQYTKKQDAAKQLQNIKSTFSGCDEIVIGTDDDPTGEGELLAWEILSQLKIQAGTYSRMFFADESEKEVQKAFLNRKVLGHNLSCMYQDPDYRQALFRTKWDYLSMQWTRIATSFSPMKQVPRQGRLKSAMVQLVGEQLDKVIVIDQSPIGRTPRSNAATYTGIFTYIRELFAATPEANIRGYKPGRFSFNVKGGRCEHCQGDGVIKVEMHFLPDVYVTCDECHGARYNQEALEIKWHDKNISQVLQMTVDEAAEFFDSIPKIAVKLRTLQEVGLGYIKIGQPATTLSGGEAQRVKLATELSRRATGRTLYILDEPTTGLHSDDVKRLLEVMQKLVDAGNTMIVIEHNLDVIKSADYIIDMGPEGGLDGGRVIAKGTPEEVAANPASFTGQYLQKMLKK